MLLFSFNKFLSNFDDRIHFESVFSYVEGLSEGSNVEIAGIKVGEVNNISFIDDKVFVQGFIDSDLPIPEDSIMLVRSNGIFGKKSLLIEPGFGENLINDKFIFNSKDGYYL